MPSPTAAYSCSTTRRSHRGERPRARHRSDRPGAYARVAHHAPVDGGRLEWREVVFGPDGECFLSTRETTPFEDGAVAAALAERGLGVRTHDGYGPGDDRTVFVAVG